VVAVRAVRQEIGPDGAVREARAMAEPEHDAAADHETAVDRAATDQSEARRPGERSSRRRGRSRVRRTVIVTAVTVVALGLAGGGVALASGGGERYRVAEVGTGDVSQTVAADGTLTSLTRADVSFSTAGTVASVDVAVGDVVTAGQQLATLDADELADAVADAEDALASAEETLASDLEAQAEGTTVSSIASSGGSGGGSGGGAFSATRFVAAAVTFVANVVGALAGDGDDTDAAWDGVDAAREAVRVAQQDLLDAYAAMNDALVAASASSDGSSSTCAPFLEATWDEAADPAAQLAALQQSLRNCQDALGLSLADQAAVAGAQSGLVATAQALDAAVSGLDEAIAAARATGGSTEPTPGPTPEPTPDPSPTEQPPGGGDLPGSGDEGGGTGLPDAGGDVGGAGGTAGGAGMASGGSTATDGAAGAGAAGAGAVGSGTTGVSVTAQRILADQAAVDVAAADLAIARAAQAAGCLTAPIAGTVAQVALAVGDEVEAGSTTAVVTVLGEDGYVVTATMDLADVQVLAVGQPASGSVGGSEAVVTGAVSSIGLTNVSSTTTPRFDVTIAVDDPTSGLLEGASASLTVAVAERSAVTIVPTSAVHVEGGSATVTVLDGGETTSVPVTLGAIGPSVTEIVEGLEAGQQVVLADLTMEIGGEEESSGGLSGLAGSSGGAGGPDFTGSVPGGGGFPGGGGGFPGAG